MISPITGSGNVRLVKQLRKDVILDDYAVKLNIDVSRFYDHIGSTLEVYQCDDTGYKFYSPQQLAGDGEFYDSIVNDGDYYSSWKKEYEFGAQIARSSNAKTILDVGCGSGYFVQRVAEFSSATGLELSPDAVALGKEKGLDIRNEFIDAHSKAHPSHYDLVCAYQVLEHVPNVSEFLNQLIHCLKPGGSLVLSVPNCEPFFAGNHWYGISNLPPHHMGLWNLSVFNQLPNYFPLKLEQSDHDCKLSVPKICVSSGLSKAKHCFPRIGNGMVAKAIGLVFGVSQLPSLLIPNRPEKRFARVMVQFVRTE